MHGKPGLVYAIKTILASIMLFIALAYALNYLEVALSNLKDAVIEDNRFKELLEERYK
jgi:arginine exporter protein ArgO